MEYVSAEWIVFEDGLKVIKAIGDDGREYFVPEADTDVPPWPDFLKKHGLRAIKTAQPKATPTPAKKPSARRAKKEK